MLSTDNPTKAHANAYMQLAELQTKLDEDDYIISMLQSSCSSCDGYDLVLQKVVTHRKELDKELRKVKKQIREIECMWRG
jgi:hypothetical protein